MKELSKINLKLILTRIFAVIVFAIAIFGALNLSTVRAEELPADAPATEETTPEDEILILNWYSQVFKLPNSYNKNNWVESEITATAEQKDSYAGRWFRLKKPQKTEECHLFNVQFTTNGVLKSEGISYNIDMEKITFSRFSVEYLPVVIDNEIYLEFYIPETFDQKSAIASAIDTVYHDYFDTSYVITYKNPKCDVVFITEPVTPEEPETPEEPGNGNVSDKVWDEFDGDGSEAEHEYGFVEKVGAVVCDVFNITDASILAVGWVTIVCFAVIVIAVFGLVFKK